MTEQLIAGAAAPATARVAEAELEPIDRRVVAGEVVADGGRADDHGHARIEELAFLIRVRLICCCARSDSVLPVSMIVPMVPVGIPTSSAAVACTCPLGATCAGCIVASDGAHPAPSVRTTGTTSNAARETFTHHHGITMVNLPM